MPPRPPEELALALLLYGALKQSDPEGMLDAEPGPDYRHATMIDGHFDLGKVAVAFLEAVSQERLTPSP